MYGKDIYALQKYGSPQTEVPIDPEIYWVDLARYAPPFLAEIRELAEIYKTQGYEIGRMQYEMEDLAQQFYISTATWGLTRWERVYGITTNLSLSYERRREILMAKIRGQGTTTKQMIEETAAAFSGGDVSVIEDNPNHSFVLEFVGVKGIPRNMQAFVAMLEDIKPAHLAYTFEYRYTVWSELKEYTWGNLKTMTWGELRTLKEA